MRLKRKIITQRLILRRWKPRYKHDLYEYARLENVGPLAGWPPHTSLAESARIIRTTLSLSGTYAITLKETGKAIGSIGLHFTSLCGTEPGVNSLELGYVLNPAYWGNSYVPEAIFAYLSYAFIALGIDAVWCACFDFNERSRRVCQKCGFEFMYKKQTVIAQLGNFEATEDVHKLTKQRFFFLAGNDRTN